jgi:hypothetical protein
MRNSISGLSRFSVVPGEVMAGIVGDPGPQRPGVRIGQQLSVAPLRYVRTELDGSPRLRKLRLLERWPRIRGLITMLRPRGCGGWSRLSAELNRTVWSVLTPPGGAYFKLTPPSRVLRSGKQFRAKVLRGSTRARAGRLAWRRAPWARGRKAAAGDYKLGPPVTVMPA